MLFCTCSNTLYFHRFKISKSKKSVRHKRFAPRSGPEAIKKYKSRKKNKKNPTSPPKNVETSGKCQSITAKKNEDQFSFLPQVISPASGQWREISPKVPAIHHKQTHTHKQSFGTRVQKNCLHKVKFNNLNGFSKLWSRKQAKSRIEYPPGGFPAIYQYCKTLQETEQS